jgi:hypothetical protein
MSASERLQAMIAHACLGEDAAAAFDTDLTGFLASHGVAAEDAEALLGAPRRLGLYRKLVRHNVTAVIETMLERTHGRIEARSPGELARAISVFLDKVGPRTPHLRDVPAEFLAFTAPRWQKDTRLPRWIVDHAELELVDFTIGVAPRPPPPPPLAEVAADRSLVFGGPKTLVRLGWAVHDMPAGLHGEPDERPVTILVYRDNEHRSRFLDLTPLAAKILECLFAGDALARAMVNACAATGHPLDDDVLGGAARLLADLGERGLLLGARPAP